MQTLQHLGMLLPFQLKLATAGGVGGPQSGGAEAEQGAAGGHC